MNGISPFLSAVIYATAARTVEEIAPSTVDWLRNQALQQVGHIFANTSAYPLVEILYALLILIVWPLDAADDVILLVHGAKNMASSATFGRRFPPTNERPSSEDIDKMRLV